MQYKVENRAISKMTKKLVNNITNPLIYYLIMKISYANFWLITKLIILGIKFKVPKKISCGNNGKAKRQKKTEPNQQILRQRKN